MRGCPSVAIAYGVLAANESSVRNVTDCWNEMALLSLLPTICVPNFSACRPFVQDSVSRYVNEVLATGRSKRAGPRAAMPAIEPTMGVPNTVALPAAPAYQTPRLNVTPASLSRVALRVLA